MKEKASGKTSQENELILLSYKDLITCFFSKNYPALDPDKFWCWFLKEITLKDMDINHLDPENINEFLTNLNIIGNQIFDPK